jgi:hypothetical protein
VSCRASDWKGTSDRATVLDKLPVSKVAPVPPQPIDADAALLDPIFSEKNSSKPDEEATDKPDLPDLLVVQLMPLTGDQRRALAVASGVTDPDTFLQAIELQGLDVLAERPGDIIELAQYWGERHQFGTLSQMTSDAILAKLKETDHYRPDNAELTPLEARQGTIGAQEDFAAQ